MWAPLPTSSLPMVLGFLVPPSELRLASFVVGASVYSLPASWYVMVRSSLLS